jgi:hypothetical protein
MRVRCVLALAIAGIALCTLDAQFDGAAARSDFRYDVAAAPAVSESAKPPKKRKPLGQVTHKAKKAATAAASGVRKITKRITNTVAALFDSDETPPKPAAVANARRAPSPAGMQTSYGDSPQSEPNQSWRGEIEEVQEIRSRETASQEPGRNPHMDETAAAPSVNEHPKCEKAKGKVGKYAFTDVEALSCEGEVYRFSATRDGKRFEVRVRAANGDLLGVERLEEKLPVNEAKPPVVRSQAQVRP